MLEIIVIFTLGLTPSVVSLWKWRQAEARTRERLRAARESASVRGLRSIAVSPSSNAIGGIAEVLGEPSCRFSARSPYIRCAVNPSGPCEGCSHYQAGNK